jgi:hypothetical protein
VPRKKKPDAPASLTDESPPPYQGTILDAMDLAGMTGPSWAPWRAFWKSVFALPLTKAERATFDKHTGGRDLPPAPVNEAWQLIGRRGGKSRNAGLAAHFLAISRDYRSILAPGEIGVIPVIAADRRQARQVLNYLKGISRLPAFAHFVERELATSVEYRTGITVEIATASYRTTRGYTIPAIIADEVAFWRSDDSAEPDTEVLDALRGGMLTIKDPLLLVLSTPYARKGELYKAHQDYFGKNVPDILVWNADTLSMHSGPKVARFVARKFEADPVVAASEYGQGGYVTFRADVESFVDLSAVQAVTVEGRYELPHVPGTRYFAFTDPSGGSQDAWTLGIAHLESDTPVLDLVRERVPPFSPAAVVADFAPVLAGYGITDLEGDRYGGEFPRELFRQYGIVYRPSEKPKSDLYKECLPLLNAGRLQLLDLPRLRTQLCGLERRVERSGKDSIDHAIGGHDDIANAVAGVLVRAARKRPVQSVRFAV